MRAPHAHSARKRLHLFSEKSAILVRFRSNSGLEPSWIPSEEFMKGARLARCAPAVRENIYAYLVKNPQFWSEFTQIRD